MVYSMPIFCIIRVDFSPNILCNFAFKFPIADIRDAGEFSNYKCSCRE